MWISDKILDLFDVNRQAFDLMREEISSLKAELAANKSELLTTKANFQWATGRINTLEFENKALMEVAYKIKLPVPQFVRQPMNDPSFNPKDFSFDDMGDKLAKEYGLPIYDEKN